VPRLAVPDNLKSGVHKASFYDPEINRSYGSFVATPPSFFTPVNYMAAKTPLAIPLGVAAGWWKSIDHTLGSVLELLRPLPALALIPLAIVWLGFGEVSKIAVIAYASFFSIYLNTQAGVRNVDPLHVKVMLIYGNGTRDVITKVVMYSILPYVFTGLRYSAAVALILLVAVELVGSQSGLGFFLVQAQSFLRMPDMFAAIVVFGVLGFCANLLVAGIERRVIKWRPDAGR
jgi:NitT/TauT family transport system permease protein